MGLSGLQDGVPWWVFGKIKFSLAVPMQGLGIFTALWLLDKDVFCVFSNCFSSKSIDFSEGIFFYQCGVSSVTLECVQMWQDLTNIYYQQATLSLSIHSYSFFFTLQSTKRILGYIYKNEYFFYEKSDIDTNYLFNRNSVWNAYSSLSGLIFPN